VAFKQSRVVREFEIRIVPMNEESIFASALQKKTAGERLAFLDEACAGNAGLRAAVEELLHADSDAGSFLAHPPAAMDATVVSEPSSRDTINSGEWAFQLPFLEPCDKPDRIGKLDQYEIIEVVGHGGMGAVLRAFDTKLSRVVAVKVMSPDLAANPVAVNRFLREAQAAAAVHHDHVVTIHAVDDAHQPPYIVMEFIEGQTLQQKIDRVGALELKHILRIGSQAAAGLAAAHNMGLIHRDVKPANILLENGVERAKITDFGLARAADDLQITQIGLIAGTPQYMSPEQAKGEPIEARSDLFSLGSVLYTMCTGRPAFRADNTIAILRRVCDDTPRPIREVNPEIPQWLETIVNKLLAKDPAERFQTAAEVEQLLNQCLAHVQNPAYVALPAILEAPLVHRATVGGDAKKTGRVPGVERSSTPGE
jgi:serine/threonine protein kinase